MQNDIDEIYRDEFFAWHRSVKNEYDLIAKAILRLEFNSVVDFGCGNGYIIERLFADGKVVLGVDGAKAALRHCAQELRSHIVNSDLTEDIDLRQQFDLVISTEVAEHIPEGFASRFIDNLTRHARNWICFTAARPGQGGIHHVNERPLEYWEKMFRARGFSVNACKTAELKDLMEGLRNISYIRNNLMILNRRQLEGDEQSQSKLRESKIIEAVW